MSHNIRLQIPHGSSEWHDSKDERGETAFPSSDLRHRLDIIFLQFWILKSEGSHVIPIRYVSFSFHWLGLRYDACANKLIMLPSEHGGRQGQSTVSPLCLLKTNHGWMIFFTTLRIVENFTNATRKKRKRSTSHNKRLQSQGQGHVKMDYRCSNFNAYFLLSCREHATLIVFAFADPLWPCIKCKVIETAWSDRASINMLYHHAKFECNILIFVWDIELKAVQFETHLRPWMKVKVIGLAMVIIDL